MLLHETAKEYILCCRDAVKDQQKFIEAVVRRKERHMNESPLTDHGTCEICKVLDDCLSGQQQILSDFEERYKRARKGIYE